MCLLVLLALAQVVATAPLRAAAVSYDAATRFGVELQADFAARQGEALWLRLDGEAMRRRTFGPLGNQALESLEAEGLWQKTLLPAITAELKGLGAFSTLQPNRILLLDDSRVLECVLVNRQGDFSLVQLWLSRADAGKVFIQDLRFLAAQLSMSRRLRQTMLLLGVPASAGLDEEDRDVSYLAGFSGHEIRLAFTSMGQRNWDVAFRYWSELPARLRAKPIWHDVRDTMAAAGGQAALAQQREQYYAGGLTNAFYRFILARKLGAIEEATAELEGLIERNHAQPFLRVVRAELLMQAGQHEAALSSAREVYEYYPYMGSAYLTALQAATAGGMGSTLPAVLEQWALLVKPEEMHEQLKLSPELQKVEETPEYVAWRQSQTGAP